MRLLFVNRFYWPETPATGQLLTDLAEAMAARGHEVLVITSAAKAATPRTETHRGVRIVRVRGTRWGRGGAWGKAVDFATFYLGALGRALREMRRGTIVVAMTDPPLLGLGIGAAARLRGAHILHWVQDIYPEVAMAVSSHRWLTLLRPLRDAAWRQADGCVTLGRDMAEVVAAAGVPAGRIALVPNWAPAGIAAQPRVAPSPLRRAWGLEGRFVIVYSGNLGRVHDLEPLLHLAALLRPRREIVLLFVGDGARRAALQAEAERAGLGNVRFVPAQPRDRLAESLAVADLHLVTLLPGCERYVFPSKLYGVAAAGRPVLFVGPRDSDISRQVTEADLGLAIPRDELAAGADFIRALADEPTKWIHHAEAAARFAARHDVRLALERWAEILASADACRAVGGPPETGSLR